MKNYILLLSFLAVCFTSCKKDPCETINCVNGYCANGDCICDPGYSGPNCSISPCDGIVCINGNCVNGNCNCETGFTGTNCNQMITPSQISVTKIVLTGYPTTYNGEPWDFDSNALPDIYIELLLGETLIYEYPFYVPDCSGAAIDFEISPFFINSTDIQHSLVVWDYDGGEDEFMGGINFTPFTQTTGFTQTRSLSAGNLSFQLTFEYIF